MTFYVEGVGEILDFLLELAGDFKALDAGLGLGARRFINNNFNANWRGRCVLQGEVEAKKKLRSKLLAQAQTKSRRTLGHFLREITEQGKAEKGVAGFYLQKELGGGQCPNCS